MPAAAFIPLTEYLGANYRPDREYVDGALLERNTGEWDHSRLQALLLKQLLRYEDTLGLLAVPEQRVQVRAFRFRVPDVCAVLGKPGEQILTRPPWIVMEVLSPDDSLNDMRERIDDYLEFGIENIWIFDPRRKLAYWADAGGMHEAGFEMRTRDAAVTIALIDLWDSI